MPDDAAKTDLEKELRRLRIVKALLQLVEELLGEKRNGHYRRRPQDVDVAADGAEGFHELELAAYEERNHQIGREAERMEERQHHKQRIGYRHRHVERLQRAVHVCVEVVVRQHRALRLARRAGGIDDRSDVFRLRLVRIIPRAAARNPELVETDHADLADLLALEYDAVDYDDAAKLGEFRHEVHHHAKVRLVGSDDSRFGILENILDLVLVELRIKRHDSHARARLCEIALDPLRAVREDYRHIVLARLKAETRTVALGKIAHPGIRLRPGTRLPHLVLTPGKGVVLTILLYIVLKQSTNCHRHSPLNHCGHYIIS